MTRRAPRIPIVLLAAALCADAALAQETAIVLRADRVLDGRGAVLAKPLSIVIEAGKITRIEEGSGRAAKNSRIYDLTGLTGLTVLPGLIDGHAHLAWHFNAAGKLHTDSDGETPAQAALAAAGNAWATLAAGITTVQSPGSAEDKDLRDAIASGQIPGPRVHVARAADRPERRSGEARGARPRARRGRRRPDQALRVQEHPRRRRSDDDFRPAGSRLRRGGQARSADARPCAQPREHERSC